MLQKVLFWASTGLLSILMLFSVYNYFFNYEMIKGFFEGFGYPTYLIYPLAIAKILGLVAIWGNFSKWLKEWAYAGFFFDTVLAFFAHYMISDGQHMGAVIAFVLVLVSYFTAKTVRP
ncbi:DoxX family protein [Croceivirga thetidis]|nr:DoxX family protein [Croceivirga thetidis]